MFARNLEFLAAQWVVIYHPLLAAHLEANDSRWRALLSICARLRFHSLALFSRVTNIYLILYSKSDGLLIINDKIYKIFLKLHMVIILSR